MKPAIFQAWLRLGLILTGLLGAFAWSPSAALGAPNSVAGVNNWVYAVAMDGRGNLYAGGVFTSAGGLPANYLAVWNGSNWAPVGGGLNGPALALAVEGTKLYVGGSFTRAGSRSVSNLAIYDTSTGQWSGPSQPMDGAVNALQLDGAGNLYVGGSFRNIGALAARRIARYNLSNGSWSAMGNGFNGEVRALAYGGGKLYAGGNFTQTGSRTLNYLAAWNAVNSRWEAIGQGVSDAVEALALDNVGNLYVGGKFTLAYGASPVPYTLAVGRIARWDGAYWRALGSGLNDTVKTLVWQNGVLYVGGAFTQASGAPASRVASWNGSAWSPMGSGMDDSTLAMMAGTFVAAGGSFVRADGQVVNFVTAWNGYQWVALATSPTPVVLAAFTASPTDEGVLVAWETVQEIHVIGFNLLRAHADDGSFTLLNATLIPAQASGSSMGASYQFLDRQWTSESCLYVLEAVHDDGSVQRFGPTSCGN